MSFSIVTGMSMRAASSARKPSPSRPVTFSASEMRPRESTAPGTPSTTLSTSSGVASAAVSSDWASDSIASSDAAAVRADSSMS